MRVVAEGLVGGVATAAERRTRQHLKASVLAPHLDAATHEQRAVPHRRHARGLAPALFWSAVEAPVLERAARASCDDGSDLVGI